MLPNMGKQNFHSTVDGLPVVKSVFMGSRSPSQGKDFLQITLLGMTCFRLGIINSVVRSVKCRFLFCDRNIAEGKLEVGKRSYGSIIIPFMRRLMLMDYRPVL